MKKCYINKFCYYNEDRTSANAYFMKFLLNS